MGATLNWMTLPVGAVAALMLAGCHTVPPAGVSAAAARPTGFRLVVDLESPVPSDPAQASVAGELALQHGDCKGASEDFAVASAGANAEMAGHAAQVALDCQNIPAAWTATQNWIKAAPKDPQAALVYASVALKLYHVPEARGALATAFSADAKPSDKALVTSMGVLTQLSDANAAFAALDPVIDSPQRSALVLTSLGGLAVEAYDFKRAEHLVQEALQRDPKYSDALRLMARIAILRGNATLAISSARDVMKMDPSDGTFELAEVLQDLGRTDEARKELERLRGTSDGNAEEIDRRLALLAFDNGDMKQAQKRFTELMRGGEAGEGALFYLGQIAEAQGDKDAALAIYRKLFDSNMAGQARLAAAGLLLDENKRAEAFALVDDVATHDTRTTFEMVVQKAHLLADHGDTDSALILLQAAAETYPHHPTLEYERATMLERAGQTHESVQAFESLLETRPDDPTVLNALGYTLADHREQLPRAEKLIRQALESTPDSPAALDSLGWVRLRRGDAHAAAGILEQAYNVGQDPDIAAHWVEALWTSGSQTQARKVLNDALARHPESAALEAARHRLTPGSGHP